MDESVANVTQTLEDEASVERFSCLLIKKIFYLTLRSEVADLPIVLLSDCVKHCKGLQTGSVYQAKSP